MTKLSAWFHRSWLFRWFTWHKPPAQLELPYEAPRKPVGPRVLVPPPKLRSKESLRRHGA